MNIKENNGETPTSIQLLSAQARLYSTAKWWTYIVLFSSLLSLTGLYTMDLYPQVAEFFGFFSGTIMLFLVFIFNDVADKKIAKAALLQEEFDTRVYEWEWGDFIRASKIKADERMLAQGDFQINSARVPWYTSAIGNLKDEKLQILLCQRENVDWDWRLRRRIVTILSTIIALLFSGLVAWGIATCFYSTCITLKDWLFKYVILFIPFLYNLFLLRKSFNKVANIQENLSKQIYAEIEGYKEKHTSLSISRLRLFQHQIYEYRKQNCLVPDRLFNWFKKGYQSVTSASTAEIIQEIEEKKNIV